MPRPSRWRGPSSVPSTKSLACPDERSWALARRDDGDLSRRYFEEEQRRQGPRAPARWAGDFGGGTRVLSQKFVVAPRTALRPPGKARRRSRIQEIRRGGA